MSDLLADGNVKATWVVSIANIALPTVAELTAGSIVALECLITKDGLDIGGETAAVENTALCSTDDTEEPGRVKRNIKLTCKRKDTPSEDKAWTTLLYKASGYLVVRREVDVDTAYAAAQAVEVYPVRCGEPIMQKPEANSVQKFDVTLFNNSTANTRAVVAA